MSTVREAAVSGTFYPADPAELRETVVALLEEAPPVAVRAPETGAHDRPAALIAPHAGYPYSGPIAASAFRLLAGAGGAVRRVVLVGPSHFVPFDGLALPEADTFAGPLGEIAVDAAVVDELLALPAVRRAAAPHAREHCLEVELPFLQHTLGDFEIVPLVTGRAAAEDVAEAIEIAAAPPGSLIVVSSDLSHYHDYETARRLDEKTAASIAACRPDELGVESACGRLAIQGLMRVAERSDWNISLLDLRSSGDTAGPRAEVVGYGAFAAA